MQAFYLITNNTVFTLIISYYELLKRCMIISVVIGSYGNPLWQPPRLKLSLSRGLIGENRGFLIFRTVFDEIFLRLCFGQSSPNSVITEAIRITIFFFLRLKDLNITTIVLRVSVNQRHLSN